MLAYILKSAAVIVLDIQINTAPMNTQILKTSFWDHRTIHLHLDLNQTLVS